MLKIISDIKYNYKTHLNIQNTYFKKLKYFRYSSAVGVCLVSRIRLLGLIE